MNSNKVKGFLAGTVLMGTLAFAAQVESQQQQGQAGQAGQVRQERGEGRGGRGGDPAQMVERRVARLTEELKLSTSQATAVRQILLDEQTQMQALHPEGRGGPGGRGRIAGDSTARGERRQRPDSAARAEGRVRPDSAAREQEHAQMEALRTQTDARIAAVLSADQRAAYQELVKNRPEGGPGRGGRGGPGGFGGRGGRGGDRQAPPPTK